MARKRGETMIARKSKIARSMPDSHRKKRCTQGFYTPFKDLDQQLTRISIGQDEPSIPERGVSYQTDLAEDPDLLFHTAMAGVEPLCRKGQRRIPPPPRAENPPRFLEEENSEVFRHLIGLVSGEVPFELRCSDEYVDGAVVGLSPEVVKKLKQGDFSYQDYIDLHGCKREEGRERVNRFLKQSFTRKLRCILIVSGRGLNSHGREPVLKQELVHWLTHAPLRRMVLAFASARSYDGGAGAFYVLLRRNEEKAPFVMPAK
jgi:DNA-nicking Smr family endonuclease